ncbi:nucleoside hydrolase [Nesterenkonia flava]|uniref:Nucleoside hydrolase n=1 Tax=Nesterenkonia flava TaxID=469799 RepID=A0ABU1FWW7_9MICC|nr:nucleoside hydrolase [Nesterenkonia flava]MDR5713108.1 nucleoside hydrolase [Nesterenkonia flava]
MVTPLVIDTDTAADDCFALLVGLLDPRADLQAITIVAGNIDFTQQAHNAFLTMEKAGCAGEVPVHLGASTPLVRRWKSASEVHGDGVGGQRRNRADKPSEEHATDALIRTATEHEGSLKIVAIGPLTNIALAVRKDPDFASRVAELVVMGGSINGRGNVTPAAEYNMYVDPEAADIVFRAGFPCLKVVSWDPLSINYAAFDQTRIAGVEALGTELSDFFVKANAKTFDFNVQAGLTGSIHCDSLAALIAVDPGVVLEEKHYRMHVELFGEHTRGTTVFDWKAPLSEANVIAVERIDTDKFYSYIKTLLATPVGTPLEATPPLTGC